MPRQQTNLAGEQTADINQAYSIIRLPADAESHLSAETSAKQFQSDGNHFMHMCLQRANLAGSRPSQALTCAAVEQTQTAGSL